MLEYHGSVVLLEELYVLLDDVEVGERSHHVVKVDAVVPYEDVVADFAPALERPHEVAARLVVGQRHLALAVYVAEHDVDVGQRFYMLGWVHAVQVGEGRELLVGEALGELVDKADKIARGGTLVLLYLGAGLAVALGVVAVVLAYANHLHAGVGLEDRVYLLHGQLVDLRIGETPLAVASRAALAVDERIVFGVLLAIDRRGENAVESMYPQIACKLVLTVLQTEPALKVGVLTAVAVGLAETEGGLVAHLDFGQLDVGRRGERVGLVGIVAYAHIALQQRHHAIDGTLAATGLDVQRAVFADELKAVLGGSGCGFAYHDGATFGLGGSYLQLCS